MSNAYNRPDQLSVQLREEVLRAAKKLGYAGPNPTARSLATSRTGAIAVLLDTNLSTAFSDPALSVTLDALTTVVDPEGHALLLLPGDGESGGPRAERILTAQADIAVAYSLADGAPALSAVRDRGLPLVVIDQPHVRGVARIGVEDRAGAAAAARHLLDLGHRRIGIFSAQCLSAPRGGELSAAEAGNSRFHDTRERLTGYLETLGGAGVPLSEVPIWEASGFSVEGALPSAFGLLDRQPRPTALLCMSDQLALAAISAARQLGLSVPGDLSVVGFDDAPPARWSEPPLTTVRQDLSAKGRIAGELALGLLRGDKAPAPAQVPTELIVRESTAPA